MKRVADIVAALAGRSFRFADEAQLQAGIAEALGADGIAFEREARLDGKNRIDFLIGRVGVEVKVGGSLTDVTTQLMRYAARDEIDELVLVTSRLRHDRMPLKLNGKSLTVVTLARAFA
jgi:dihydrodipicolinate synthase/N-acetylneuraminate lyase